MIKESCTIIYVNRAPQFQSPNKKLFNIQLKYYSFLYRNYNFWFLRKLLSWFVAWAESRRVEYSFIPTITTTLLFNLTISMIFMVSLFETFLTNHTSLVDQAVKATIAYNYIIVTYVLSCDIFVAWSGFCFHRSERQNFFKLNELISIIE